MPIFNFVKGKRINNFEKVKYLKLRFSKFDFIRFGILLFFALCIFASAGSFMKFVVGSNAYQTFYSQLMGARDVYLITEGFYDADIAQLLINKALSGYTVEVVVKAGKIAADFIAEFNDSGVKLFQEDVYIQGTTFTDGVKFSSFKGMVDKSSFYDVKNMLLYGEDSKIAEFIKKKIEEAADGVFEEESYYSQNFGLQIEFSRPGYYFKGETLAFAEGGEEDSFWLTQLLAQFLNVWVEGVVNDDRKCFQMKKKGALILSDRVGCSVYVEKSQGIFYTTYLSNRYRDWSFTYVFFNKGLLSDLRSALYDLMNFENRFKFACFIKDANTGWGIGGAEAYSIDNAYSFVADEAGWIFAGSDFVPTSPFKVFARHYEGRVVSFPMNGTYSVVLNSIKTGASITGTVNVEGLFSVEVRKKQPNWDEVSSYFSNGAFTLTDVPTGEVELVIRAFGYETYVKDMFIEAGKNYNVGSLVLSVASKVSIMQDPVFKTRYWIWVESVNPVDVDYVNVEVAGVRKSCYLKVVGSFTQGWLYRASFELPPNFSGELKVYFKDYIMVWQLLDNYLFEKR